MANIENGNCKCADCESKRQNEEKHLNHPFYQEVREYKSDIAFGQILKGAEKYPNPFIPDQWTGDELADHAMQEMHDGSVYITGMRDRMRKQDAAYNNLLKDYNELKAENEKIKYTIVENCELRSQLEKYKERCKAYEIKLNINPTVNPDDVFKRLREIFEKGAVIDERV